MQISLFKVKFVFGSSPRHTSCLSLAIKAPHISVPTDIRISSSQMVQQILKQVQDDMRRTFKVKATFEIPKNIID